MIGRLNLESWLEEWVRNVRAGSSRLPTESLGRSSTGIAAGIEAMRDIVGRVWM